MRLITIIIILFSTVSALSQSYTIKAKVDERTELLSIVFRLAEAEEYSKGRLQSYNKDIELHFANYKNHKAVRLAKKLGALNGVGFDAVMDMAVHIEIFDSTLLLKKNIAKNSLDKRWNKKNTELFASNLGDFYRDTKFNTFFNEHNELYTLAENRFNKILNEINFKWFSKFYGQKPEDNYKLILSMSNGGGNYASKVIDIYNNEVKYAIIGTWYTDTLGKPIYKKDVIPTVVHEFNHSYCNHLIIDKSKEFEKSGKTIYAKVKRQMKKQAYGSYQTMLYEALVRASVIKYTEQNDTSKRNIKRAIANEQGKGFIWIDKLVKKLSYYEKNRDQYKTLESFMPEIVLLYDSISENFNLYYDEFHSNCPKIIYSSIKNKSKVKSSLKELIFKFNKPMQNIGYGFSYGKYGKEGMPKIISVEWIDSSTIKLNVELSNAKEYSIKFFNGAYLSKNNYPLLENFELQFKTQ